IYAYSASAESCHNVVRLTPRTMELPAHSAICNPQSAIASQTCLDMQLTIPPAPATLHCYDDYFGNKVHSFAIYQPHLTLTIIAESQVSIEPRPALDPATTMPWQEVVEWFRSDTSP